MARLTSFTFRSRANEVQAEFDRKMELALNLIGTSCEGKAKNDCPVDTGRLRNSIAHEAHVDEKTVYIGSNVEYAKYVEFLSMNHVVGKAHFLRDAVTTHNDEYKKIAEAVFKS